MQKALVHIPTLVDQFQGSGFYIAQFKTPELAIFSYYIESKGKVVLVDPPLDIDTISKHADQRKATIQGIFQTHFHADFIAGHLAKDITIYMGEGAAPKNNAYSVTQLKNGHIFKLGDVAIRVIHTPGHTPESSCFLLSNRDGKDEAIFTGDTLFLGEVGRPDLATSQNVTQEQLASQLFDSLQKLKVLTPSIRIYPAHGSGSSCGKKISDGNWCTLQKQLQTNYALKIESKAEFVKSILDGLGKPPQYYFHDATLNKSELSDYEKAFTQANNKLSVQDFLSLSEGNAVIDTRSNVEDLKKGYIKGAYLFFEGGMLAGWIGSIISPKTGLLLFTDSSDKAEELIRRILRIGYHVIGYNGFTIEEWIAGGGKISQPVYAKPDEINNNPDRVVVDVRNQPQWVETGTVKGAITISLPQLENNIDKIPKDKEVFVHCKAGGRARVGASILERHGIAAKAVVSTIEAVLGANETSPYN